MQAAVRQAFAGFGESRKPLQAAVTQAFAGFGEAVWGGEPLQAAVFQWVSKQHECRPLQPLPGRDTQCCSLGSLNSEKQDKLQNSKSEFKLQRQVGKFRILISQQRFVPEFRIWFGPEIQILNFRSSVGLG